MGEVKKLNDKSSRSKIKPIVYCVVSFILALDLFALTVCSVLASTILNPSFIFDNMNSSHYFQEKCDEITDSLEDLTYASGLKESFFDGLITEVMISNNTQQYLDNYFSGNSTIVDSSNFKDAFNTALDEYIAENNIENVKQESRDYLVEQGALIYQRLLDIPLFVRLAPYITALTKVVPFLIIAFAIVAVIVIMLIIFTNKWKHRALRYLCYAFSGAFLSVVAIPVAILFSGKISKANFFSRAFARFFEQAANNVIIILVCCALLLLIISVVLFAKYYTMRKKLVSE